MICEQVLDWFTIFTDAVTATASKAINCGKMIFIGIGLGQTHIARAKLTCW